MSKTIIEIGGNTNAMIQEKMKTLITELNEASDAYYNGRDEIMTNYEWDAKFNELRNLEMETGIVLPNSPTQKVGASEESDEIMSKLPKVKHEFPARSLDKTKDISKIIKKMLAGIKLIIDFVHQFIVVMWKMDGGTVVATYDNGNLTLLATRGDGEVGSDITFNAKNINGLPLTIPYTGHAVFRGEVVMSYADFERVNNNLPIDKKRYENARNLATATLALEDDEIVKDRNLQFFGFNLVYLENESIFSVLKWFTKRLEQMKEFGFQVVPYKICKPEDLETVVNSDEWNPVNFPYPVDGLVTALENHELAAAQPGTGHHPHQWNGYALKWEDEVKETRLVDIEWQVGRTGIITPVAIFEPVRLEGTTVSKASLHNLSFIAEKLGKPYVGQKIYVYKSNKIIPCVNSAKKDEELF